MKISATISYFITNLFGGKLYWQNKFEYVNKIALVSMNYGLGSNFRDSGEKKAIDIISKKIKNTNAIIFDIGANVGGYSVELAKVFSNTSKIYSFEPSSSIFHQLQKATNQYKNIQSHNFAFGDSPGTATLFTTEKNSELASLVQIQNINEKFGQRISETIIVKTIDSFCEEEGISKIDFMKIDVEGFEIAVLKGAEKMLQEGRIHFIQFEFGVPNIDSRTYFRDFWNLLSPQYNIYRIVKNGLFPISNYSPTLEVFLTSNFIAEKK